MVDEVIEQKKEEVVKEHQQQQKAKAAESQQFTSLSLNNPLYFSARMEKEKILEAALFMSPKAISLEELNEIAEVGSRLETKSLLEELISFYRTRKSALEIVELPVGYQMRVKSQYEDKVKQFAQDSMFHRGIMKTLALIAYKQPITQSAVIQFRNNKGYDHVKELLENGFIKKEPRGKTFVLSTTTKFVEYFGKDFGKGARQLTEKQRFPKK